VSAEAARRARDAAETAREAEAEAEATRLADERRRRTAEEADAVKVKGGVALMITTMTSSLFCIVGDLVS